MSIHLGVISVQAEQYSKDYNGKPLRDYLSICAENQQTVTEDQHRQQNRSLPKICKD